MISSIPEKGKLLIAEPSIIGDISFNRSVVLLADHTDEGSIGFILNKPFDFGIKDLLPEVKKDFMVFNGGPVEQDNLYFIHNIPELIPNSVEISNGVFWGGDFYTIIGLINEGTITDKDIRFFLGYSGWHTKQLENELNSNSWVVVDNVYKSKIISKKGAAFWKEKMLELGDKYSIWSNAPENPSYN